MSVEQFLCKTESESCFGWFFGGLFLFFSFPSLMIHAFAALGCCVVVSILFFLSPVSVCLSLISLALSPSRSATREIVSEWVRERETKHAELNQV
jgi:hypothetical protein